MGVTKCCCINRIYVYIPKVRALRVTIHLDELVLAYQLKCASPVVQNVWNLLAVQEIHVQSLGWEDPLEKGMATHSSILAWEIPWTEEPGGLLPMGLQRVAHD